MQTYLWCMSELHVVLGAGPIGSRVAQTLVGAGKRVRQVRLTEGTGAAPGVELVAGDLSSAAFAAEALRGGTVAYQCVSIPYAKWRTLQAPLARGILAGARAAGTRLVALDNMYMYGAPAGRPLTEDSPVAPCSAKGAQRAELASELLGACARGDVAVTVARACNFFGPHVVTSAIFGASFYERMLSGKAVHVFGDADALHSYSYAPDVAAGLVALGQASDVDGKVWHLPVAPAESTRSLIERIAGALGASPKVSRVSDFLLRSLGLVSPIVREMVEMTYQWKSPFVADDSRFRARFGFGATPLDVAAGETAAWARVAFGLGTSNRKAA
jgi:nucleoside-diphosphate-sugar epimerase